MILLPLLLPLLRAAGAQPRPSVTVRNHYIAAVEIGWDYIHLDGGSTSSEQRAKLKDTAKKYIKAVYREYTDSTYSVPKPRPPWAGKYYYSIQGPVIYAQARDRVVVHFKNLASQPYSISPVGVTYWKQSEGVGYDDSTAGQEKEDDAVAPGGYYEYVWEISPHDGPTMSDPECLTYSYSSQVNPVRDVNSGLIGALLICKKPGALNEKGERKNPAFVLMFAVFDENKSWYSEVGERRSRERYQRTNGKNEYHTINGYTNSTLPGLTMCQGTSYVFWHLIGVGTAPRIHSIQFQDHALQVLSHRKVILEMTSMSFITAEMRPATVGHFSISCQIHAHHSDGMQAKFTVDKCLDVAPPPGPDRRNAKHSENEEAEDYPDLFETVNFVDMMSPVQARSRGQHPKSWEHFIAAEEIIWNYAPHLSSSDSELQSRYLPSRPHHSGYRYKKVAYVEYTDASFTQRKNPANTFLGPLLKGKISDQFRITFKNLASRPYNIYPNSLSKVYPMYQSVNAAKNDLRSLAIQPNETFGYIWKLTPEDGPLESDPLCLTQLYQSTVSPEEDLASGLVGSLLVCRYDALDPSGNLIGADQDSALIFGVFDENKSWYHEQNIPESAKNSSKTTEADFYNSNVIYSINGLMFRGRGFVMCSTDVAFWHVASVGTQSDFLSVYFTGNLFLNQGLYHSVLTLFPMTGMTIAMEMELTGEWEISAFDGSLRNQGMSVYYSVRACDNREFPIVDHDDIQEDISDYMDLIDLQPRGSKPQKLKMMMQLCKKVLGDRNATTGITSREENVPDAGNQTTVSEELIPLDVLEELETEEKMDSRNETEFDGRVRQRRGAEGNWTDGEHEENTIVQNQGKVLENRTDGVSEDENIDENKFAENNEIIPEGTRAPTTENPPVQGREFQEMDLGFVPPSHIPYNPEDQIDYLPGEDYDYITLDNNATQLDLSLEYDDYSDETNITSDGFGTEFIDMRSGGTKFRHYYIAAEELAWDYGITKPHQLVTPREMQRGMRKFLPDYKKVVFRAYRDKEFKEPLNRGESTEHLGLMGPLIRAEINDLLFVVFKNNASRPFSFHLHGIYDHSQGAGFTQSASSSAPAGVPGDPVPSGQARTYVWKVSEKQGPSKAEFDCKPGAYYSTVDKERDLHSGLIGPLLICRSGTLRQRLDTPIQEFSLLFHSFDETKSWYFEENLQRHCAPPCHANPEDPWFHTCNTFSAINGYVAETLPGLLVAQHQLVRWHLINVGRDGEYHAVQFHGLPFTVHTEKEHRMGVFNLFPGVFGSVEMKPSTAGTWLVECTVGDYQLAGMRAKLLVYDPRCMVPLGMKSGRISDSQISASDHIGHWEPRLARLHQSGYINAWMGRSPSSWIQIDLLKPTLVHGVQTQGVRSRLKDYYVSHFCISYSLDQETWTYYRGNTTRERKIFSGSIDSSTVKQNLFRHPLLARYVRVHPRNLRPALRLELLGCDLNSCSFPLGLQKLLIPDNQFRASSNYSSFLRHWGSNLARLHLEGSVNAWRPKTNNPREWLEVDLGTVKRITGVVTQGAKSLLTPMMVTEFAVSVSDDRRSWSSALEPGSQREKVFPGNSDPDEEAYNVIEPPLFGRYIRINPRGWINDIALRLEVLGCDTQQSY
ncbi:coagulation factor VIII [Neosynchiropus ocellatus]